MKSKTLKALKVGTSKRKVSSDVSPSTSLPPLVEGPLRCFLRVTVSRLLWTIHKPPPSTFVRLRWWGESSKETHFFPRDGSQLLQKSIKTTARFAVRCGPKQFTSYLTDMGSLVLEVLTKSDHFPIARAQVSGISRLSLSLPISGFYTLVSPTSEKLGELQVSLKLEPLTEAYDSSGSCPHTDVSVEVPQVASSSARPRRSLSAGSGSSSGNTPRGKDHLYFQENQMPTTNGSQNGQTAADPLNQELSGPATKDILSVISERGNKLRDAMVLSALKCDVDSAAALKDTPLPLPKDNILPPFKPVPSPSGMFLENILHADSSLKRSNGVADSTRRHEFDCAAADLDNRAVEILLGGLSTSRLHWDGDDISSGHSSVGGDSELNDPQYDQSLLENLFYKTPMMETRADDTQAEAQGTVSSSTKQPKQISGGPTSESRCSADAAGLPAGLTAEQSALLSLIRVAKVSVDSLTVSTSNTSTTLKKTLTKGKPPRPLTNTKCTYFVEYALPSATTSSPAVTKAVSSKVTGGVVKFLHCSVFPVHFSTATVKHWWQTDLIFKIFSQRSDQRNPVLIGEAAHPLRCLLQKEQLSQSVVLPVGLGGHGKTQEIGPLLVSLELAADRVSSSGKSKSKLSRREKSSSSTAPCPQGERFQLGRSGREELPRNSMEDSRLNVCTPQRPVEEPTLHPGPITSSYEPWQQAHEDSEVLLHTLLMVPDGKNFSRGPVQAPNVYLNCKLFWCDEMTRSVVSWGQTNPSFNFAQVTPVALTPKLLERMKNNMMVIEVWQKTGSSGQDRLLGLVKLPLHQFYMSFRDPKIARLLLQAQYPVLGVDCYMPVVDVFSGGCEGNLRVVLAMGGSEQIVALQRSRDEEYDHSSHWVKPVHLLDQQPRLQTKVVAARHEPVREHVFVIRVEKVTGLTPLQSTVWGEADCYVQYTFPRENGDTAATLDQNLVESSVDLKQFRTTTTLCVPDPVFGHTETHVLLAPEGVPVQTLLLSSLSSRGLSSGGGVQFEVWCRYYYPNVRDQLVAKGLLPLSKLCAMVTMQRQHPEEAHMFSLPLIPRTDGLTGHRAPSSGLLDVCVRYKHRPVRPDAYASQGAASRVVTLVVEVHRASGLQVAARLLSEQDERFDYFASVGVNTYVTVQLSFTPDSERRRTRVVARTFCPEFDHHAEVSCDLLVQRSSGETCSLAELLQEASAVFTVWNTDNREGFSLSKPKDAMLGTVKIPLDDLIHKRTGISGWFGVYLPQETGSPQHRQVLVGGLEISVSFAHHSDRERVIKAAQGLGWVMSQSDDETQCDEESWEGNGKTLSLSFSIPRAWMPVHCLLLPGHAELQRSTYCYFRYKFYEQEAFCSQMKHPSVTEADDSQATVSFEGSRAVELRATRPLMWYLREERLELQLWLAFKKDKTTRPTDTDRLVGSAFVDLSSLAKIPEQKLTLSGVYPLFRRSAADLQGAALRVHITLTANSVPGEASAWADTQMDYDSQGELSPDEVETAARPPSPGTLNKLRHQSKSLRTTSDVTSVPHTETTVEDSFPVTVVVDRAMHLNLKSCPLAERSETTPCSCVSYVTADSAEPVFTTVVSDTDCPEWDHQQECRLPNQLLVDPQQSLVFKVWHKGEVERVLGFASVDLTPLLCGFHSVYGWYNITDFSGQCHGQLKVSVTPLKGVQDLREQRRPVNEEASNNSSVLAFSYHTTATYSSFPSHISRYTEQKISSPEQTDRMFPKRSSDRDGHVEHMDKVRFYHQSLQEQAAAAQCVCNSSDVDMNPSSSFLLSALRKNQSELDNMQRYFSRKLSTPAFTSASEHNSRDEREERRETDTSRLLLKTDQLVGKCDNLISGLQGIHLDTIASHLQSSSVTPSCENTNLLTIPESISSLSTNSNSSQEDVSPPPLLLPTTSEEHRGSEAEEDTNRQHYKCTVSDREDGESSDEEKDEVTCIRDEGAEEDEDDDYDVVVVKPRHLNELTSLTDKTSPWTSFHSDPDLVSLESVEAPEEPDLSQDEDETKREANLETLERGSVRQEDSDSFRESVEDVSEPERDDGRTLKAIDERSPCKESDDSGPSTSLQHNTDNHDSSLEGEDSEPQTSVPVDIPNFFLPSHQLEASMRTIHLAPTFSHLSGDTTSSGHRRRRPQRPNMSPSSMKKATDRIAKIFATHFDESH
ncbi:C2 domain-containing protein 3 [Solea senegalensis]|uniref:C2 domain-containing protein 3 n=2 Tax=Solea senegalensis TaxID=28829 RepID=A0AAV6Q016_SOLSE|nr:C2 domain-containing protein 3 [Solea senegalensis]KAG7479192.1 C2 domain-containing protein 3 [Solea senegalensis]